VKFTKVEKKRVVNRGKAETCLELSQGKRTLRQKEEPEKVMKIGNRGKKFLQGFLSSQA